MKLAAAFFRLVRFPNLVFIAVTQILFYYGVILPFAQGVSGASLHMQVDVFWALVAASVTIAAGGYIINDYFDLNIDRVNRPSSLVIEKSIKRRWAMVWHIVLSFAGLVLSFYVGYRLGNPLIGLGNLLVVILLWFYSTTFKKQLLVGNVVISLLTAWVVLILYACETQLDLANLEAPQREYLSSVFKTAVLYGGFAFVISLVREVVKDMEDMEGDARYHCRTMPIAWGIPVTRSFTITWMIVLAAAVLILVVYTLQIHWWWMAIFMAVAVFLPSLLFMHRIRHASRSVEFAKHSRLLKGIMLAGIVSMVFFKIYL
jgi:4-hydroxybenzoate polyprenyltransferase